MTAASQLPPPSGAKPVRQVHPTGERGSVKKEGIQGKRKEKNGAEESWDEWHGGRNTCMDIASFGIPIWVGVKARIIPQFYVPAIIIS